MKRQSQYKTRQAGQNRWCKLFKMEIEKFGFLVIHTLRIISVKNFGQAIAKQFLKPKKFKPPIEAMAMKNKINKQSFIQSSRRRMDTVNPTC